MKFHRSSGGVGQFCHSASGYLWVYHHSEYEVLLDWHKSRANTCLGHITWRFREARDGQPCIAARVLPLTDNIYQIEKRLRQENADLLD